MKINLKTKLLVLFAIVSTVVATAQVYTNKVTLDLIGNSNVLLDGSSSFSTEVGQPPNVGKGIIIPSVDLVNFEFDLTLADGSTFPTFFDGMFVYNNATGTTLTAGNRSSTATPVTPGFYYFFNPNGFTNENVTGGVWTAMGASATPSVTVNCTGFAGLYSPNSALSGATYQVTFINNDNFTAKQVTPLTTDLTLSGISGVTVTAVSPSVATTVNGGESLVITYTLTGTPAASGTLTGTFAKHGLTCSSTVKVACGAFVAAGVFKEFACYNLGATTTLNSNVPEKGIHGNYYQWGIKDHVADTDTTDAAMGTWNTTPAPAGAWLDASKNITNDPCPPGFRVPTKTQWDAVVNSALNTVSRTTGAWTYSPTNFGSAIHITPNGTGVISLTLVAAGNRGHTNGQLNYRGVYGGYWSSTEEGTNRWYMGFGDTLASTYGATTPLHGLSVRCVSE